MAKGAPGRRRADSAGGMDNGGNRSARGPIGVRIGVFSPRTFRPVFCGAMGRGARPRGNPCRSEATTSLLLGRHGNSRAAARRIACLQGAGRRGCPYFFYCSSWKELQFVDTRHHSYRALGHNIQCDGCEGEALAEWVIESSANHFGYKWSFEIELTETLWLLGRLGRFQPQEVA